MKMMMMIVSAIETSYEHRTWPLTIATRTSTLMPCVDLPRIVVIEKVHLWQLGTVTLRIRRVFASLMFVYRATVPCEVIPHHE